MKPELGRTYRTRGGQEAVINCRSGIKAFPFSGAVLKPDAEPADGYLWTPNGHYVRSTVEDDLDLVEEIR